MHSTFSASVPHLIVSAAAILLLPVALPGILLAHLGPALRLAIMFGALNACVRPFMRYLDVPETAATYALFSVIPNAILALWTTIGTPAIVFSTVIASYLYVAALSAANAYAILNMDRIRAFGMHQIQGIRRLARLMQAGYSFGR